MTPCPPLDTGPVCLQKVVCGGLSKGLPGPLPSSGRSGSGQAPTMPRRPTASFLGKVRGLNPLSGKQSARLCPADLSLPTSLPLSVTVEPGGEAGGEGAHAPSLMRGSSRRGGGGRRPPPTQGTACELESHPGPGRRQAGASPWGFSIRDFVLRRPGRGPLQWSPRWGVQAGPSA